MSPTGWLVSVLFWTASKNNIWSLLYIFHWTEVKLIVFNKRIFLIQLLQLAIVQYFYTVLYNQQKYAYRYLFPIVVQFLLQNNTRKFLNKNYYCKHKTLVLTVVFFKWFNWFILKLKLDNYWTYKTRAITSCLSTIFFIKCANNKFDSLRVEYQPSSEQSTSCVHDKICID